MGAKLSPFLMFVHLFPLLFDPLIDASQPPIQCLDDERSALLEFKQNFLFEGYSSSSCLVSWNPAEDQESGNCCSWDGIECDGNSGHVISLDLSSCGLYHPSLNSNSSLFRLTYLEKLNLAYNFFNDSPVPSAIGSLLRLKVLDLSYSDFSGQVAPEITELSNLLSLDLSESVFLPKIAGLSSLDLTEKSFLELKRPNLEDLARNLTKLEELHLSGVKISAPLPDTMSNLSSLKSLKVSDCMLRGEPPSSIFRLPNLQILDLSSNRNLYGELPTSLRISESLEELHMGYCNFSGMILPFLSNRTKLSVLDLAGNSFQGPIPSFNDHNQLVHIDLSDNALAGEIPSSIRNLTLLSRLNLCHNQFSRFPFFLGNLTALKDLSLCSNGFTGPIPSSLGNLIGLQWLDLSYNQLTGPIPTSLGNLTGLWCLDLYSNQLIGRIPTSLGNLTALGNLDLRSNQLTGPIPTSLGNLAGLWSLDLSSNGLNGPIPTSLGNLTRLELLDLGSNQLIGRIPTSLGPRTALTFLELCFNRLTGPIPYFLGNLTELEELHLCSNQFTGRIPASLRNLAKLGDLQLDSNQLNGTIPYFLGNLTSLNSLDLSCNQLTGQIPDKILPPLQYLNLSHNQLTGHVPDFVAKRGWNTILDLRSNKLYGPLPVPSAPFSAYLVSNNSLSGEISSQICNMSTIAALDLAKNNFSGSIPQCLSNLSNSLQILDLHDNNFSSVIPHFYEGGCHLKMMDVSGNQLEGQLPRSLVNCEVMEYLNLGNNLIDDKFPFWLGSLSSLSILILRNNRFHGGIVTPHKSECGFPRLQIIDISHNNLNGSLPSSYFKCWKAMMLSNLTSTYYLGNTLKLNISVGKEASALVKGYDYSMEIISKGSDTVFLKIFNCLIAIDLSSNNFSGKIPSSLRLLQGLYLLNLSHNALTGQIPHVLSDLAQLEALDLSHNRLSGMIPWQLSDLGFLEVFNVSYNQLSGSIPQGKQFDAFDNSSYKGNVGLCGRPLSKKCGGPAKEPPSILPGENLFKFDQRIILMGFASGLVIGVFLGQGITIRQDNWFVAKFGRRCLRGHCQ